MPIYDPSSPSPSSSSSSSSWAQAEARETKTVHVEYKKTLPLEVRSGIAPVEIVKLSDGHYFFDFGIERMAGLSLSIPQSTVTAWGGDGAEIEIRLAEQLAHFNKHEVLYPGLPFDPGNWNKIPKYVSTVTLSGHESGTTFEHHEYPGLWRYGEIRVKEWFPKDPSATPFELSQWSVHYPWEVDEASFSSDNEMLNKVWKLCADTIKYTSLDTFTDS